MYRERLRCRQIGHLPLVTSTIMVWVAAGKVKGIGVDAQVIQPRPRQRQCDG